MKNVILVHKLHGSKVAISEVEITHDLALGWEVYDAESAFDAYRHAEVPVETPVETPVKVEIEPKAKKAYNKKKSTKEE